MPWNLTLLAGEHALLWSLFYLGLTHLILGGLVLFLPLLRRFKPKFAKWFAMRYWPEPLAFQPQLWLHAVSVGEVQMARALLATLGQQQVLITTTTQSGYKILRQSFGPDHVRYLPWDLTFCYHRLFGDQRVPHLLVLETEIWPQLFKFVTRAGAQLLIINGRVSRRTMRLRRNSFFRQTLALVTEILARGEEDKECFEAFGVPSQRIQVVGNIKYDAAPRTLVDDSFKQWLALPQPLLVFASISSDEISLLIGPLKTLLAERPSLRVLWVPRHLETLADHLRALAPLEPQLRTHGNFADACRLVVLDGFGELSGTYAFARASLVGGSFNRRGGQNFLESLQSGTPVLVGPSTENFREETAAALQSGALQQLSDETQIVPSLGRLLDNEGELTKMRLAAKEFLQQHGGALLRTKQELINRGILPSIQHETVDP